MLRLPYIIHVRADSRLAPSKWETSLQSNAVSHWLDENLESALHMVHCVDSLADVLLTMWDQLILVSCEHKFQVPVPSQRLENADILCFLQNDSPCQQLIWHHSMSCKLLSTSTQYPSISVGPSHKSHNASDKDLIMHHFVTEMSTCVPFVNLICIIECLSHYTTR